MEENRMLKVILIIVELLLLLLTIGAHEMKDQDNYEVYATLAVILGIILIFL